MNAHPSIQPASHLSASRPEAHTAVAALCRLTGLAPGEVASFLAEIDNDDLPAYRMYLLADALPSIFGAYLAGGYPACASPEIWPALVRACVASFCFINGLKPSLLAPVARKNACGITGRYTPTPEDAAAMMYELDDLTSRAVRF